MLDTSSNLLYASIHQPTRAHEEQRMNRTTAVAHTPIPWEVDIGVTQISIRGYDGHAVCIDTNPERGREEIIANYTLICDAVNRL